MNQKEFILESLLDNFGPFIEKIHYIFDETDNVHFVRIFPFELTENTANHNILSEILISFEDKFRNHYLSYVGKESLIQFSDEDLIYKKKSNYYTFIESNLDLNSSALAQLDSKLWMYSGDTLKTILSSNSKPNISLLKWMISASYKQNDQNEISLVENEGMIGINETPIAITDDSGYSLAA